MIVAAQFSFGDCRAIVETAQHVDMSNLIGVAIGVTLICILFDCLIFSVPIKRRPRAEVSKSVDTFFVKMERWLHRLAVAAAAR